MKAAMRARTRSRLMKAAMRELVTFNEERKRRGLLRHDGRVRVRVEDGLAEEPR